MSKFRNARLMAVSETNQITAVVRATDPADLRPFVVTGKHKDVLTDPLGVSKAVTVRQQVRCTECGEFPKKCAQNGCWL